MLEFPRVTAGENYPAYAEEWVDVFVGLLFGMENGLIYTDNKCQRTMFKFATNIIGIYTTFDTAFPTTALPLIFRILSYLITGFLGYSVYTTCSLEAEYQQLFHDLMGDHEEEHEEEEMAMTEETTGVEKLLVSR